MPLSLVALAVGAAFVAWRLAGDRLALQREAREQRRVTGTDAPPHDIALVTADNLGACVEAELAVIEARINGDAWRVEQAMFAWLDEMMRKADTQLFVQDRAALALYSRCIGWFETTRSAWLLRRAIGYGEIYARSQDMWADAQSDAAAREMRRRLAEHSEVLKTL